LRSVDFPDPLAPTSAARVEASTLRFRSTKPEKPVSAAAADP